MTVREQVESEGEQHRVYIGRFWLLCLLVALLLLSGCAKQEQSGKEEDAERGFVSIVVQDRGAVASSEGSYEQNRWTRWIQENAPVDVHFVPVLRSESKKLLGAMFASGAAPDIINETNAPFRNHLYEQNQLLPLDSLLEYMPNYQRLLEKFPQLRKAGTRSDGKLYELGRISEASPLHVMFIRQDWLEQLDLDIPKTTDELLAVAEAFVRGDPDQNGVEDTLALNISYSSEGAINEIFGIQQDHSWGWSEGRIIRQWDKELAALQFKKQLYDMGAIDSDYTSDTDGTKAKRDFLGGKLGIYVNYSVNWAEFTTRDLQQLRENSPGAVVVPLEYPVSPFGQFTGAIDNPIQMTTVFNRRTSDPVAAAKYVNFILEPATTELLYKGEEGVHWNRGDNGCPVLVDLDKWRTEVSYASGGSYGLFMSRGDNACYFIANLFNPELPQERAGLELYEKARELYMDPAKQYPGITLGDYVPGLPGALDEIRTRTQQVTKDLYVKAIVGGSAYSAEQAVTEAKLAWDEIGGEQIVDYMNKWYKENEDSAFLIKDLWEIIEQQQALK